MCLLVNHKGEGSYKDAMHTAVAFNWEWHMLGVRCSK